MLHISDTDDASAAAGKFRTALTAVTGQVDTTVVEGLDLNMNIRSECRLDNRCGELLDWIRTTFPKGIAEANAQAERTKQAADVGVTALRNADIDGAIHVRSAEV